MVPLVKTQNYLTTPGPLCCSCFQQFKNIRSYGTHKRIEFTYNNKPSQQHTPKFLKIYEKGSSPTTLKYLKGLNRKEVALLQKGKI